MGTTKVSWITGALAAVLSLPALAQTRTDNVDGNRQTSPGTSETSRAAKSKGRDRLDGNVQRKEGRTEVRGRAEPRATDVEREAGTPGGMREHQAVDPTDTSSTTESKKIGTERVNGAASPSGETAQPPDTDAEGLETPPDGRGT